MILHLLLSLGHFTERYKPIAVYYGAAIVVLNGVRAVQLRHLNHPRRTNRKELP